MPALQLLRERLRLLEQILGARVCLDGIDDDADAFGQLIQERFVRRTEAFERRELEHTLDLTFEDDRQHQNALWWRGAKAGENADVIERDVRQ